MLIPKVYFSQFSVTKTFLLSFIALMHAVVFGNVTAIIQRMYARRSQYQSKWRDLKDFIRLHQVRLVMHVFEFIHSQWHSPPSSHKYFFNEHWTRTNPVAVGSNFYVTRSPCFTFETNKKALTWHINNFPVLFFHERLNTRSCSTIKLSDFLHQLFSSLLLTGAFMIGWIVCVAGFGGGQRK